MEKYSALVADEKLLNRFRQGIRFRTVSTQPEDDIDPEDVREPSNPDELLRQLDFIEKQYPTLHSCPLVKTETVNKYSRLHRIQGRNADLLPYLLTAHMDVVPVDEEKWDYPPFDAEVVDGEIYGRGTLDMKATLYAILEAIEHLLAKGFQPQRTIYLAFGHDEEIGGYQGAKKIADLLTERKVKFEFVLDEGTGITYDVVPGIPPTKLIGLIAVAEKGYATINLSVSMPGGHSSIPAKESSIGILAKAITRLEASPQPCMFGRGPEIAMLQFLAPQMSFFLRFVMQNLWLFGALVKRIFARKPATDSLQRTTTAVTMFHAGIKSNVIAQDAVATVNHRIHPAQTLEEVLEHDRRTINDPRVKITVKQKMEVGHISPFTETSFGFQTIRKSLLNVYPDAAVAPSLMMANTDSRFYTPMSNGVYKFMPWVGTAKIVEMIHGNNERISIVTYEKYLNFYMNVFLLADRSSLNG